MQREKEKKKKLTFLFGGSLGLREKFLLGIPGPCPHLGVIGNFNFILCALSSLW